MRIILWYTSMSTDFLGICDYKHSKLQLQVTLKSIIKQNAEIRTSRGHYIYPSLYGYALLPHDSYLISHIKKKVMQTHLTIENDWIEILMDHIEYIVTYLNHWSRW